MAWFDAGAPWQLAFDPVAFPKEHDSFHPQGLVKLGDHFFMSTVDKKGKVTADKQNGYIYKLHFDESNLTWSYIDHTRLSIEAKGEPQKEFHPGGMDYCEKRKAVIVPLSQYRANSTTTFLALNPETLEAKEILADNDHYGSVICTPNKIFATNWHAEMLRVVDHEDRSNIGEMENSYQDCKFLEQIGSSTFALCGGLAHMGNLHWEFNLSLPAYYKDGFLDLIEIELSNEDGDHNIIRHGSKLVDVVESLPMTHNTLECEEVICGPKSSKLRFYFAPHDFDRTRLFVYESPVFNQIENGEFAL